MRKGSDTAAFFSANSCQRPKRFPNTPEGKAAHQKATEAQAERGDGAAAGAGAGWGIAVGGTGQA